MSLVKKPKMTERKVAANRQNQSLCNGPVTDERRERIRTALLCFGLDVQAEEIAMRALGEEPAHFQKLLEELWEEWNPTGGLQEGVVISLGRSLWLMNRAARMQEGCAVRQAQELNSGRQDRAHAQMMRIKMTEESLRLLAQSVAHEHYVTPREDLEKVKSLHQEGVLREMGEIALALFYQLQAPGTGADGIDRNEQAHRALVRIKEIFGLNSDTPPRPRLGPNFYPPQENRQDAPAGVAPDVRPVPDDPSQNLAQTLEADAPEYEEVDEPYPNISTTEWEARERPRQLLENILTRQVEICQKQRQAILKESVQGPSPYERAAEIAPTHPNAGLMQKMQDSNFREVRRLTNLLLKIKRYERERRPLEQNAEG